MKGYLYKEFEIVCNQIPCVILVNLIKEEYLSKFQFVILTIFEEGLGSNENP